MSFVSTNIDLGISAIIKTIFIEHLDVSVVQPPCQPKHHLKWR